MQASRNVDSSDIQFLLQTLYQKGGSITSESLERSMRLLQCSLETFASLQEQCKRRPFLKGRISPSNHFKPASYAEIFHKVSLVASESDVFADHLLPHQRAYGELVMRVVADYCRQRNDVLEIGCGGYPLLPLFSDDFPMDKARVTLSDVRHKVVSSLQSRFKDNQVKRLDLLHLSTNQAADSLDMIIMGSVLDTLTIEQMKLAFEEMYKCLKPGGVMVHFAPRSSYPSSTTHDFTGHDLVVFPLIDEEYIWKGIKVVNKAELLDELQKKDPFIDKVIIDPLTKYLMLEPAERDDWCHQMVTGEKKYQMVFLTESLDKLNCSSVKTVYFKNAFDQRLNEACQIEDSEVLFHGNVNESYIGNRMQKRHFELPNVHLFKLLEGVYYEEFLGVLQPGVVQELVNCHVFVWKKSN